MLHLCLIDSIIISEEAGSSPPVHDDREKIKSALLMCKGNKTLAAKHLGISRVTLWKKVKDLNIANP